MLHPPKNQDDLGRVRGLSAGWRSNDIGARLIAAIEGAKPLGADELPERDPKRPGLTKDAALVSDLLKLLLKIRSKETGVAAKLIARSDDLEALAAASARTSGSFAAGGTINSARTRSTWSKDGSHSPSRMEN